MTSTPSSLPQPPNSPDTNDVEGVEKKKWGKGKIAGVVGGGCCSLILLVFIIMVIVAIATGGGNDAPDATATTEAATELEATEEEATTEPEPTEEPTTEPEATEEEATEEEPTEEATTEAEATTEEAEPTEEAATEAEEEAPAESDAETWAASVEKTTLLGEDDWQSLCGGDYSLGICWISDVTAERVGDLEVTIQLTGSDAEAKQLAEGAANTIFSTAGFDHEDLDWVIVYGADGVVIDQKKRSDYPYLS